MRRATKSPANSGPCIRYFYPRSPCGERRPAAGKRTGRNHFYPRSPCGERRLRRSASIWLDKYFYPRSPCGERLYVPFTMPDLGKGFLSTLSLRRATTSVLPTIPDPTISIHALLAESDTSRLHKNICVWGFLSTLSLRRATSRPTKPLQLLPISIHALLAESDQTLHRGQKS